MRLRIPLRVVTNFSVNDERNAIAVRRSITLSIDEASLPQDSPPMGRVREVELDCTGSGQTVWPGPYYVRTFRRNIVGPNQIILDVEASAELPLDRPEPRATQRPEDREAAQAAGDLDALRREVGGEVVDALLTRRRAGNPRSAPTMFEIPVDEMLDQLRGQFAAVFHVEMNGHDPTGPDTFRLEVNATAQTFTVYRGTQQLTLPLGGVLRALFDLEAQRTTPARTLDQPAAGTRRVRRRRMGDRQD